MAKEYANCLVCPITFCLFCDPVVAEDGHTYERQAIIDWINCKGTSPLTRESVTIAGLRPNHIVRSLLEEFRKSLSKHSYKFKLDVDIERSQTPFFHTTGKALYEAKWIRNPGGPRIVLLKLSGARAEKEASFYENLTRHPHIVYTYGLVEPSQENLNAAYNRCVMLLQEMASCGNLIHILEHHAEKHPNKILSDILLKHIFLQIIDAMIFLTSKGIIHGDLACRNILVFHFAEQEPERTLVKLTDFGISRGNAIYSRIDFVDTAIDTVPVRSSAPEVLQNTDDESSNIYSEKSDMFAFGVLMWETYSNGQIPWNEIKKESIIRQKVISGERLSRPNNCKSDKQWELILKCMSQNPNDRPTFIELSKQLKEFVNLSNSSAEVVSPSTEKQNNLPIKKSKTEKVNDSQQSSDRTLNNCLEKQQLINSDRSSETNETIVSSLVGNVKSVRELFERKIEQQSREHSKKEPNTNQKKQLSSVKLSFLIKKTEDIPPQEDLIKLAKWH